MKRVTVCIKTFERPTALQRALRSIRDFYPDISILVADDSLLNATKNRNLCKKWGAKWLLMPPDSGLICGRSLLVQQAATPLVFIMDDHQLFVRKTNLELAQMKMEAGKFDTLRFQNFSKSYHEGSKPYGCFLVIDNALYILPPRVRYRENREGCYVVDIVENVFLAKRAVCRRVGWDKRLKLADSKYFFWRCKLLHMSVGFCPDVKIRHKRSMPPDYADYAAEQIEYNILHLL